MYGQLPSLTIGSLPHLAQAFDIVSSLSAASGFSLCAFCSPPWVLPCPMGFDWLKVDTKRQGPLTYKHYIFSAIKIPCVGIKESILIFLLLDLFCTILSQTFISLCELFNQRKKEEMLEEGKAWALNWLKSISPIGNVNLHSQQFYGPQLSSTMGIWICISMKFVLRARLWHYKY